MKPVVKPKPSFGSVIRGTRLGWRYSERHGAFIRMSDCGEGTSYVELAPINGVPRDKTPLGFHRHWWDDPGILEMIPWLKQVRSVKRYICVVVDDDGNIIRSFK